jgi:hypothetical protein
MGRARQKNARHITGWQTIEKFGVGDCIDERFDAFLLGPAYGMLAGTGMMTSAVVSLVQFPLLTAAIDGGREAGAYTRPFFSSS